MKNKKFEKINIFPTNKNEKRCTHTQMESRDEKNLNPFKAG